MPGSLDPEAVWQAVDDEKVNSITVVGDAVAKPAPSTPGTRTRAAGTSRRCSRSANGGAPLSPAMKARIAATFPDKMIIDGFGSSETGAQGSAAARAGRRPAGGTGMAAVHRRAPTPCVRRRRPQPVEPGSGVVGRLALAGRIPLGYHNDPEKTAETFVEVDGRRYVITGDMATVEADGSIQLLGRGSQCINTGGEKVFPEEVEAVLHGHPAVADVLVVGVPDERWGSAVTAVVAPARRRDARRSTSCASTAAPAWPATSCPKHLVVVDRIRRSPAGKADYRWAEQTAEIRNWRGWGA